MHAIPIRMEAYDYRGFTIIVFPSGKSLIHRGSMSSPPEQRPIATECHGLSAATRWIDASIAEMKP